MATSRKIPYLLIGLFTAVLLSPLFAQSPPLGVPEILNFSKSDYRAGTQNWCILQNDRELLLVGNNKGLLVFDGSDWELIALPNQTIVRSLAQGPDGRIYLGAQDELGYLTQRANGQWGYQSLVNKIAPADRSFEDVWKIFAVEDRIYFGAQKALFIYEDDRMTRVVPLERFENFFWLGGQLYARDTGYGLVRFDGEAFRPVDGGERFRDSRIAAMLPLGDRRLILTQSEGFFALEKEGPQPWEAPVSPFLRQQLAYCAVVLDQERLAIGTVRNGLVIIDSLGQPTLHLNKRSGLQNNTILTLYPDRQGNFWLGLDNGIDLVKTGAPFTQIRSASGIEGTGYASLHFDGRLYLGTNQGLYHASWPRDQRSPASPTFEPVPNLRGQIWQLQALDGDLIVNTHEGAFYRAGGTFRPLSPVLGSWKFLPLAGQPNHAIQGAYTGLYVYRRNPSPNGPPWLLSHKLDGFEESARVLEQDQEGHIWVSHAYKGLYRITLTEDIQTQAVRFYSSADGLPSDIAINVAKIGGQVVFTANAGIYYYDPATNRFVPQTRFNQMVTQEPAISRLLEDERGRIWFVAEEEFGFFRVREKGFLGELDISRSFFNHLQEGLVDGFEHIYALDDRHVIIASEKGFMRYDPLRGNKRDSLPFNVLLREVTSMAPEDSLLFSDGLGPSTPPREPLRLHRQLNNLRFTYVSPFFEQLGQIQYRYRLEGYDEEWSDWTYRQEKEYTNLPPGTYQFMVTAQNAYGQVSETVGFPFVILPPWYASSTAMAIYVTLGILGLLFLSYAYSQKLEKERKSMAEQQAATLARKEARFQEERERSEAEIIRLRNENLRADIQHKNAVLASTTMHLVQKSETLQGIKRELEKLLQGEVRTEEKRTIRQLVHSLEDGIRLDDTWDQFEAYFDQVHGNFLQHLREAYPTLTPKDQKLCAYLRMNLSTKEIAPLMNISVRGVEISRYRLRKKLDLDTSTNLTDFLMRL